VKRSRSAAAAIGLSALMVSLSACSQQGAEPAPAEIEFWGWAPGQEKAVEAYNAAQDKVTVKYQEVAPGAKGGYEKMLNAVKAGNAPCLAQVGYETLPSFVAQGALEDISTLASAASGEFLPAAWSAVTVEDAVYGAPVDVGPMALFYNKELFDSLGLSAPTTWEEYRAAGEKITASDPAKSLSAPYLDYDYAGLAGQAEANWFAISGDAWDVSFTSSANKRVGDYWQGLVVDGLISTTPMYDQAWFTKLGNGEIATVVGAAWQASVISGGAADGAGKWAVAPMPQWEEGENRVGNAGGSATAVMKGCPSTDAAWDFAHWMSTDDKTFGGLIETAGFYPAATDLATLPQLATAHEYFGGQRIYDVFADAASHVNDGWVWGPTMTQTVADLNDGLGGAWNGTSTFDEALASTQKKTVDALTSQNIAVAD
jgi:multiple sugar transport system substrate-binding protein